MRTDYTKYAAVLKAIAEPTRLEIVDMLSCGELCACVIQEKFDITQPTLSHHMKVLCDSGVVIPRREGKWTHYSLHNGRLQEIRAFIDLLSVTEKNCICKEK
ncbi:MAG: metalloregulator ArsR/SmtB family transcription factor [Christensenella sp.]|uniref:ArsR/SmtB family transcription factor n=1 Tax=Christensenella sp. TaxID=1935934 RepID=UPI002B215958|nr:metalloregulator ArsR/SmtB family transcription factor [Christensenella sp.]MEA5003239.1 metalloregulator ArsR/SmtB family transcription factor [Christensenella sp.]